MNAQVHYDHPTSVDIYDREDSLSFIAHLPLYAKSAKAADAALKKLRLRRTTPWLKCEWGLDASVEFVSSNPSNNKRRKAVAS